ncbi:hypothetical protein BDN72DRAFT_834406 [Pluteus cervinus]|uniref:Uncharacterized protein n=1 Tax=Pluteus cervinus TaxID=181527 RepID=A0ACD3B701_9AGAR|nr:hypothetical protein BDN72DRAFT_834406 [Pluteus cervinus]
MAPIAFSEHIGEVNISYLITIKNLVPWIFVYLVTAVYLFIILMVLIAFVSYYTAGFCESRTSHESSSIQRA